MQFRVQSDQPKALDIAARCWLTSRWLYRWVVVMVLWPRILLMV